MHRLNSDQTHFSYCSFAVFLKLLIEQQESGPMTDCGWGNYDKVTVRKKRGISKIAQCAVSESNPVQRVNKNTV